MTATSPADDLQWLSQTPIYHGNFIAHADASRLQRVGQRPPLGLYLRQIWARRHFIWAQARAHSLNTQRGTVLGNLWLVVKPMLDASVYFLMFGVLLQTSNGIDNFIGYLIIGVTMFAPMTRAVLSGSQVMISGKNLIRAFTFPRATLPVAFTVRNMINLLPPLLAIAILVMALPPHKTPALTWFLIIPIFVFQQLFCLGLTLITARITTFLPDTKNLWTFLTRIWFYGSGVFFSYKRFAHHPALLTAMNYNPGHVIIEMYREVILYDTFPSLREWLVIGGWSLITVVIGIIMFWRKEEEYGVER